MKIRVRIEGWRDSRNSKPVSLVDAMRQHAGLSLPSAKKLLDDFSDNGEVVVELCSRDQADAFVKEASAIGAVVRVLEGDS